jgi:hypothetical protein
MIMDTGISTRLHQPGGEVVAVDYTTWAASIYAASRWPTPPRLAHLGRRRDDPEKPAGNMKLCGWRPGV